MPADKLNFQNLILRLSDFWRKRGCLLLQPVDKPVGAGTFHDATFLRALGPEPWACAYPQACRRPADGRYGFNPNRLQHYYQFQVVIKPSPVEILNIYLDSLVELGIDVGKNDIRCVEDNWNSPSLGAWGVGWEIWCNGMEVTQFTYFQQVGGIDCDPVCCEITYGLERIAMYLQDVANVFDLVWGTEPSGRPILYGELFQHNEQQCSKYNFELADVSALRRQFEQSDADCRQLIDAELPIPAYQQVLDLSHSFNLLEARGSLPVVDRQNMILRVRELACLCAQSWLKQRTALNYPLGQVIASAAERPSVDQPQLSTGIRVDQAQIGDVLFEIGVEPLPVGGMAKTRDVFVASIKKQLQEHQLACAQLRGIVGVHRLGVFIDGLNRLSDDQQAPVLGPPVPDDLNVDDRTALADYKPAVGFAKSQQVPPAELTVVKTDKGRRLAVHRRQMVAPIEEVLTEIIAQALQVLPIDTPMRWGGGKDSFVRPVHWVLFLIDHRPVAARFYRQTGDRYSRIQRRGRLHPIRIDHAAEYFDRMRKARQSVGVSYEDYQLKLKRQLVQAARTIDCTPQLNAALLDNIAAITTTPKSLVCQFDQSYLVLPQPLIRCVLESHQRCVTVTDQTGQMNSSFLCVSDRSHRDQSTIQAGHEKVVRARLADADYFWKNDLSNSLEDWQKKLADRQWYEGLGSYTMRIARMHRLVGLLARHNRLTDDTTAVLESALSLGKIDLCGEVIGEYPELDGVMASHYLRRLGVEEEVCRVVGEHTLPRFAGDRLPPSFAGRLCALVDRIDGLIGLYCRYRGRGADTDPFGVRRICLAIIRISLDRSDQPTTSIHWPLVEILTGGCAAYHQQELLTDQRENVDQLIEFILKRYAVWHQISHHTPSNVVEAAVAPFARSELDLARIDMRVRRLSAVLADARVNRTILTAYKRMRNILDDHQQTNDTVREELVQQEQEIRLHRWLKCETHHGFDQPDWRPDSFIELAGILEDFFARVMIQCEDRALRDNRRALLCRALAVMSRFADFSRLV